MVGRGAMKEVAKDIAKKELGVDLTLRHLRLMSYLDFCIKNNKGVDPNKIGHTKHGGIPITERDVYSEFKEKGFFINLHPLIPTKKFYDVMQEILYHTYVDYEIEVK